MSKEKVGKCNSKYHTFRTSDHALFCQFFFRRQRCFASRYFPWIIVHPPHYFRCVFRIVFYVRSFRYEPSYQLVRIFVASTLICAIWIIYLCPFGFGYIRTSPSLRSPNSSTRYPKLSVTCIHMRVTNYLSCPPHRVSP